MVSGLSLCLSSAGEGSPLSHTELLDSIDEALEIGRGQRSGRLMRAVDPNERYEANFSLLFLSKLAAEGSFETLFRVADEAFEAEFDKKGGATRGPQIAEAVYQGDHSPPPNQPIHNGELGGLDGSSCRSCHFSGGPDGAGSGSQLTLLRGDGERLESAVRRDPPHVMGLGYISLAARDMQAELDELVRSAQKRARLDGRPYEMKLEAMGVSFGAITAQPDGQLDRSQVEGISADLKLRPFGWKGRHAELISLCDEALQVHHGIQSQSRIDAMLKREDRALYLGAGSIYDPDEDGKQQELSDGQGVAMAAYVSLLGAPIIKPPRSPRLALAWSRGRESFETIGCAGCHRTDLRFRWRPLVFERGEQRIEIDLREGGQAPKLRTVDFSPTSDGRILPGTPLLALTDLKRHEMGPELAEPVAERLPDGGGEVSGSVWLTRPLWGLADSAPYLHDGRAQTVEEAILWHGGEAESSRRRYQRLSAEERGALRMYLMSLTREAVLLVE